MAKNFIGYLLPHPVELESYLKIFRVTLRDLDVIGESGKLNVFTFCVKLRNFNSRRLKEVRFCAF